MLSTKTVPSGVAARSATTASTRGAVVGDDDVLAVEDVEPLGVAGRQLDVQPMALEKAQRGRRRHLGRAPERAEGAEPQATVGDRGLGRGLGHERAELDLAEGGRLGALGPAHALAADLVEGEPA